MTPSQRAALRELAKACTPQNIDSAERIDKFDTVSCPLCDGDGQVECDTYLNYDGCATGVEFFGVGDEHVNAEKFFRACDPQTVTALLDYIDALEEKVKER